MIKEVLDKHGLKYFNDTVNERLKNRLKYKGKYTLIEDQEDWDKLAPTHIGDTYLLAGDEVITIDNITFKAGEWVVAMNETRLNDDDEVVDESGAEAHVKVEKLGSASLPNAEDDGDGLAFVDGEWAIQKNYGYYKPEITKYEFSGILPPPVMPVPIVFQDSHPLIVGNKYKIVVNGEELGEFTAEEQIIFSKPVAVLNIDTDGWNRIAYEDGHLRLNYDTSHSGETVTVSIEGEFEGDYVKFDKRYIETELPEDAQDADAMVYQWPEGWKTTPEYGYYHKGDENFESSVSFLQGKKVAHFGNFGFLQGQSYTIKIGDEEMTETAYETDGVMSIPMWIGGCHRFYSIGENAYLELDAPCAEAMTLEVSIEGELSGWYHTFDKRYIEGMADGKDDGDGLAYRSGKWEKQPGYGYYKHGDNEYYNGGIIASGNKIMLTDFPGLVYGEKYEGYFDGHWFYDGYPFINDNGKLEMSLDNGWNRMYQDLDGKWYAEADSSSYDGNEVAVLIMGTLYGDYYEFDKRYIPPSITILETLDEIPAVRDDKYRSGDLFYVKKDTTNIEITRYQLKPEAVAEGWLMLPSIGFEIPNSSHYLTWAMLSAMSETERSELIRPTDDGSIYRVTLTDGTVKYGFYYENNGAAVTVDYFASKTMYVYDKDTDSFNVINSEVPSYDKHVPIECNFITDLSDNLFDE